MESGTVETIAELVCLLLNNQKISFTLHVGFNTITHTRSDMMKCTLKELEALLRNKLTYQIPVNETV